MAGHAGHGSYNVVVSLRASEPKRRFCRISLFQLISYIVLNRLSYYIKNARKNSEIGPLRIHFTRVGRILSFTLHRDTRRKGRNRESYKRFDFTTSIEASRKVHLLLAVLLQIETFEGRADGQWNSS